MRICAPALYLLLGIGIVYPAGCAKASDDSRDISFSCEIDPKPPRLGSNTFTITLRDKDGTGLSGARVSLEGDMSHPGMSPVFGEAKEIAAGRYEGTIELNMRGDWTVLLHITLVSGQKIDRQVKIPNIQAA